MSYEKYLNCMTFNTLWFYPCTGKACNAMRGERFLPGDYTCTADSPPQ